MENVKLATLAEAKQFFAEQLRSAMSSQSVTAAPQALDYLADLLVRHMSSDSFFAKDSEGNSKEFVLADLYAEYLQGNTETQKIVLQKLGDICLIVTGFFSDSLSRKIVDLDYYFGMGGGAYWQLSRFPVGSLQTHTYRELSQKFKPFSNVLGEMSEKSGIQNNSDLLRTYEKWLFTGSERLRTLLSEHGIEVPFQVDTKTRH